MAQRDSVSDKPLDVLEKLVYFWGPDVGSQLYLLQRFLLRTVTFCQGQQKGLQRTKKIVVLRDALAHPIYRADKLLEIARRLWSLH